MFVKIMSGENLSDDDPKKTFNMYADVDLVNLSRDQEGNPEVEIINGDMVITVKPIGNVYCLGDMGAPIAFFSVKDDDLFYDKDNLGIS